MSGTDYTMANEDEKQALIFSMRALLTELRRFDYMAPYSYRDIISNPEAKELFEILTNKLNNVCHASGIATHS